MPKWPFKICLQGKYLCILLLFLFCFFRKDITEQWENLGWGYVPNRLETPPPIQGDYPSTILGTRSRHSSLITFDLLGNVFDLIYPLITSKKFKYLLMIIESICNKTWSLVSKPLHLPGQKTFYVCKTFWIKKFWF